MGKKHLFSTKSDKKKKKREICLDPFIWTWGKKTGEGQATKRKSFYRNLEWRRKVR